MGKSKPPRKPALKRRVAFILLGAALGLVCRYVPPEFQGPCSAVTKIVGLFLGTS